MSKSTNTPTVIPPTGSACPTWCTLPADHDLHSSEAATRRATRLHSAGEWTAPCDGQEMRVEVVQATCVDDLRVDPPRIYVEGMSDSLAATEARQVASALLAAAGQLEIIELGASA